MTEPKASKETMTPMTPKMKTTGHILPDLQRSSAKKFALTRCKPKTTFIAPLTNATKRPQNSCLRDEGRSQKKNNWHNKTQEEG